MAERVKPKRRYNSPRRQEQAAATRRSILDAAERLFERQGYAATTMEAIAAEAGVALKTVYVVFETKSGLLRALWDLRLKGDEDEAAVSQRQWYLEVIEEPDPERQLRLNARNARIVKLRIAPLLEVIRDAAPVEPDTAALWELIQTDFYANQRVDRRVGRREARAEARPRRDARGRHPLDAQPPRPVAAARRPARLDARAVRAVVRRHRVRATPRCVIADAASAAANPDCQRSTTRTSSNDHGRSRHDLAHERVSWRGVVDRRQHSDEDRTVRASVYGSVARSVAESLRVSPRS